MDHVVERSLQLEIALDESRRLMRLANFRLVELEAEVAKEKKGHALYKRLFEKNAKFLRTTFDRLESSSWENEQELTFFLNKYGNHLANCSSLHTGGIYPCDCGWQDNEIALALLEKFREQK